MKIYCIFLAVLIMQFTTVSVMGQEQGLFSAIAALTLSQEEADESADAVETDVASSDDFFQSSYIVYTIGSVMALLLVVFFYRIFYASHIISRQNKNLSLQQKELEEAQQKLQVILKEEQEMRKALENSHDNLKAAQSQLIHAEKMSSLGQLTAGIAHEINNPVSFIKGGVQTLKTAIQDMYLTIDGYESIAMADASEAETKERLVDYKKESDELMEDVKEMVEQLFKDVLFGTDRVTEIVDGLRVFSRHDEATIKSAGVHENLDAALLILKHKYKDHAEIIKQYDPNVMEIDCLPGQLNQVFVNLISNAVDAMEEFGTLIISTQDLGNKIQLSFKDNGKGIPDDVKDKIFDPFFTTKDVGEGTGLGLSISHSIIEEHKGNIEVFSGIGYGTEFRITLPKELEIEEEKKVPTKPESYVTAEEDLQIEDNQNLEEQNY